MCCWDGLILLLYGLTCRIDRLVDFYTSGINISVFIDEFSLVQLSFREDVGGSLLMDTFSLGEFNLLILDVRDVILLESLRLEVFRILLILLRIFDKLRFATLFDLVLRNDGIISLISCFRLY